MLTFGGRRAGCLIFELVWDDKKSTLLNEITNERKSRVCIT